MGRMRRRRGRRARRGLLGRTLVWSTPLFLTLFPYLSVLQPENVNSINKIEIIFFCIF